MENIILVLMALIIIGAVAFYLYKAKKKGKGCVGCPYCNSCNKNDCNSKSL